MQRILCLWLPNWPIQRLVVEQPQLKRTRILLWHRDPRRGQRVSAVSPLAQRDGIRPGVPLSEAIATLQNAMTGAQPDSKKMINTRRHPRQQSRTIARTLGQPPAKTQAKPASTAITSDAPKVLPADPQTDRETLRALAISCQTLAPIVGLETAPHPDCLFLDVTNLWPLYGSEVRLTNQVVQHFKQKGYLARAAIADTLGAAWGLVHYIQADQFIAPSASQLQPLEPLPIQALRLQDATCETLRQLGITRINQLLQLPRTSLTARFGDEINLRLDQASGKTQEVFQVIHTPSEYMAEKQLEWPVKDIATTMVIIQRLAEQLCQELKSDAYGALQWQIRLTRQQSTPVHLELKLFQPTTTAEHVMQLVEMQLDHHPEFRQATSGKGNHLHRLSPITEVCVYVTHSVPLGERQRKLFDEDPSLNRIALAQLINRLSSRLGQEQVTRPVPQANAQPEFSFQLKPLVTLARTRPRKSTAQTHYVMARPLRLLNPAIQLQPSTTDQTLPPQFRKPDQSLIRVQRHWGPERIETGWWRGRTICRDYWRIESNQGAHLWIYRNRRTQQWFLHGEF